MIINKYLGSIIAAVALVLSCHGTEAAEKLKVGFSWNLFLGERKWL